MKRAELPQAPPQGKDTLGPWVKGDRCYLSGRHESLCETCRTRKPSGCPVRMYAGFFYSWDDRNNAYTLIGTRGPDGEFEPVSAIGFGDAV